MSVVRSALLLSVWVSASSGACKAACVRVGGGGVDVVATPEVGKLDHRITLLLLHLQINKKQIAVTVYQPMK